MKQPVVLGVVMNMQYLMLGSLLLFHKQISILHCQHATDILKWIKESISTRVTDIELLSFSPLVFSIAGWMGPIAIIAVFKRLAS